MMQRRTLNNEKILNEPVMKPVRYQVHALTTLYQVMDKPLVHELGHLLGHLM